MNSISEENCCSDERNISHKPPTDTGFDEIKLATITDITDSTLSYTTSPVTVLKESRSLSPVKRDTVSSIIDDSGPIISDCSLTMNVDLATDSKSEIHVTETVDLESDKGTFNSSDVVLVEDCEKSIDEIKNPSTTVEKVLEISANSDIHIIESPHKMIDSKLLNDSVQVLTSDQDGSVVLSESDIPKPLKNTDSFKKIVAEDPGKFISPVYCDSKISSDNISFETQPAYSTPNETTVLKTESGQSGSSSTESFTSIPPIYKRIRFYAEVTAAIYMTSKESWTAEMTDSSFNLVTSELVPSTLTRLSDTSGNLADTSKSISPSSSTSINAFPLKPNRISMASSSSFSSGLSSATTLARKMYDSKLLSRKDRKDIKSDDSFSALYEKWINSTEMCNKFLSFVDKYILHSSNDEVSKEKLIIEEVKPVNKDKDSKETLTKIVEVTTPVSTNKVRQTRGKRQGKVNFSSDSEGVPKKRQRRAESIDVVSIPTKFTEGDSVFAKWGDRKFYAATLGEMTNEGKWQVNFFDGDKKTLLEEFLIKAEDYSTMVGSNVYASQGDDNFTPGIITGFDLKDGILQYIVVRDKGDISVPCQFIYITESQARQIRAKSSTYTRTPSKNENIILTLGNKRSTRSKTRQKLDSPMPGVSGTQQTTDTDKKYEQKSVVDSDDEENEDSNEMNVDDVAGVEPESHGVYENGIKLKGKTVTGKMRFSRSNKSNDTDASVLGPVPDEGSKYFKNFHVLLTCTRPQSPKLQVPDNNSSGNATSSENENYTFSTIPFVKDRLKLQLQMAGAIVYNHFDDIPQKSWKNTYLISNRPNTSAKYIQCLAAGIKILCHEWVIRCCIEKKKVPLQELPLGWSLERERYFHWYDRKSLTALKKINLLIADTGDKNFIKFWINISKLADINVSKLTRDSNLEQVTAIISESGYRDDHLERALSHNIPIVTTTWFIQSLLHGEPRQFDGHKTYLAEYVDSD